MIFFRVDELVRGMDYLSNSFLLLQKMRVILCEKNVGLVKYVTLLNKRPA